MSYSVSLPDGRSVEFPDEVSHEQAANIIRDHIGTTATSDQTQTSTAGAFGHGVLRSVLPSTAGIIAGGFGATAGAPLGPLGALAGGLGAGTAAAAAVDAAQEKFLKENPHVADFLGLGQEQEQAEAQRHPYASLAGQLAPNLVAFKPSLGAFRSLGNAATEADRAAIISQRINAGINAGIGGGMEAAQQGMSDQPMDWVRVGEAAAGGALAQKETNIGRMLTGAGESVFDAGAQRLVSGLRRPEPEVPEPLTAPLSPEQRVQEQATQEAEAPPKFTHDQVLDAMRQLDYGKRNATQVAKILGGERGEVLDIMREMKDKENPTLKISDDPGRKWRYEIIGEEKTAGVKPDATPGPDDTAAGASAEKPVPAGNPARPSIEEAGTPRMDGTGGHAPADNAGVPRVDKTLDTPHEAVSNDLADRINELKRSVSPDRLLKLSTLQDRVLANKDPAKVKDFMSELDEHENSDHREFNSPANLISRLKAMVIDAQNQRTKDQFYNLAKTIELNQDPARLQDYAEKVSQYEAGHQAYQREKLLERLNALKIVATPDIVDKAADLQDKINDSAASGNPDDIKKLERQLAELEDAPREATHPLSAEQPAQTSPGLKAKLMTGDFQGALEHLARDTTDADVDARNPVLRALAKHILNDVPGNEKPFAANKKKAGVKLNIEGTPSYDKDTIATLRENGRSAMYDARTNTIHLTKEGLNDRDVVHEAVHAVTARVLRAFERGGAERDKLTPDQQRGAKKIFRIFKDQDIRKALYSKYPDAFSNVYEFLAHAMTDDKFQRDLAKMTLKPGEDTINRGEILSATASDKIAISKELVGYGDREKLITDIEGKISKFKKFAKDDESNPHREYHKFYEDRVESLKANLAELRDKHNKVKENIRALQSKPDTIWNRFTTAIKEILGIPHSGRGNVMLELSQAMGHILKQPTNTPVKGVGLLYAPKRIKAPQPKDRSPDEIIDEARTKREKDMAGADKKKTAWDRWTNAVITLQNDRRAALAFDEAVKYAGLDKHGPLTNRLYSELVRSPGKANDNFLRYFKNAFDSHDDAVRQYATHEGLTLNQALDELGMYRVAEHEQDRRREHFLKNGPLDKSQHNKILFNGQIFTAADLRDAFYKDMEENKDLVTNGETAAYHKALMDIMFLKDANGNYMQQSNPRFVKADGYSPMRQNDKQILSTDMNDAKNTYQVLGGYSTAEMQRLRDQYHQKLLDPKLAPIFKQQSDALAIIRKHTIDMDRAANYWTQPVDNITHFYGFGDNYVPFKGRPELESSSKLKAINEGFDFTGSKRYGSGYHDMQLEFSGRKSLSSNPLLQMKADAVQSALRNGRYGTGVAIENLVKLFPSIGKKIKIAGEPNGDLPFSKRQEWAEANPTIRGPGIFFVYKPDGAISIYQLHNKSLVEAIRRTYKGDDDIVNQGINAVGGLTQWIAKNHTRWNLAFAPFNFVRHSVTNAAAIWADMGFVKGSQFLGNLTSKVLSGNIFKTYNNVRLYDSGAEGIAKLEEKAKSDPFTRDMLEFFKAGGKTTWITGLTNKSQYEETLKHVKVQDGVAKTADQISTLADHYGDMFEITTRVAAYQTAKEYELQRAIQRFTAENQRGPTADELAEIKADKNNAIKNEAATFTKELINYEHRGTLGKQLGSLYAFWRANMTGAVRAIDALMPAFMTPEAFLKTLPREMQVEAQLFDASKAFEKVNGRKPTEEELEPFKKSEPFLKAQSVQEKILQRFKQRQNTSRILIASMLGAGMSAYTMSYLLANRDDSDRNEVATDDHSMWTRSWRIPVGKDAMGKDNNFVQIPWGFGGGALGGVGAQTAMLLAGHISPKEFMGNTILLLRDSYMPLPAAEFNVGDNTGAWVMDSILPSAFRPIFEYVANVDTFGRQIHNNNMSKFGGVYEGGDYIPRIYQEASRHLAEMSRGKIMIEPTTLHFFASNYIDGIGRISQTLGDGALAAMGDKDIDAKTALLPFGNFIGKKTSYDARKYAEAEADIKQQRDVLNSFSTRPDLWRAYVDDHPDAPRLVMMYNRINDGPLKRIRTSMNQLLSSDQHPSEYIDRIRHLRDVRDMIMARMNDYYNEYHD